MRISYLLAGFGYTGGNVVLYNFMDQLTQRGHEVFAITPNGHLRWEPGLSKEILTNPPLRLAGHNQMLKRVLSKAPLLERCAKKAFCKVRGNIDSVIAIKRLTEGLVNNWIEADATIATYCFTAFANYALMERTVPLYHMQHYEELFFTDAKQQILARATYFLPLSFMANSSWLGTQIKGRFKRDAFLLTPAISHEIFYPRVSIAEKYSFPRKIRIVSYADARAFKGWEDGLAAMKIVFSKLGEEKIEWVVFGGYQPEADIPVRYVGKVFNEDLAALYSSAHIVFMPSWYESFPLPPLEAMNCGTAAVCTQFGTEDYAYDKQNALVVPPRNPQALAEAIIALATDPKLAKRLALNGLATAHGITWEKSTDRLEDILKRSVSEYKFRDSFADVNALVNGVLND